MVAESVLRIVMEADVDGLIGAGRHERPSDRSTRASSPAPQAGADLHLVGDLLEREDESRTEPREQRKRS